MKKLIIMLATVSALISCAEGSDNPLDIKFGDPYVLLASDGHYYMYGTGGVKDGFGCYMSDDLVNWEYHGRTAATGDERVVFIDKMAIKDGRLTVDDPTTKK